MWFFVLSPGALKLLFQLAFNFTILDDQQPRSCKVFLVNLILIDKATGFREVAAVVIPNSTTTGWKDLEETQATFNKIYEDGRQITIGHVKDFHLKDGFFDGYTKSWEKICQL